MYSLQFYICLGSLLKGSYRASGWEDSCRLCLLVSLLTRFPIYPVYCDHFNARGQLACEAAQ